MLVNEEKYAKHVSIKPIVSEMPTALNQLVLRDKLNEMQDCFVVLSGKNIHIYNWRNLVLYRLKDKAENLYKLCIVF